MCACVRPPAPNEMESSCVYAGRFFCSVLCCSFEHLPSAECTRRRTAIDAHTPHRQRAGVACHAPTCCVEKIYTSHVRAYAPLVYVYLLHIHFLRAFDALHGVYGVGCSVCACKWFRFREREMKSRLFLGAALRCLAVTYGWKPLDTRHIMYGHVYGYQMGGSTAEQQRGPGCLCALQKTSKHAYAISDAS